MSNRYVKVTITRQTKAVSQAGFGVSLILSDDKDAAYKEYTEVDGIGTDFGIGSETYKLAQAVFGQSPRPATVAVLGELAPTPAELVAALTTLVKTENDFFYLHCTDQSDAAITALSDWIDTQNKLYFASTSNKTLHATLASQNTVLLVTQNPGAYPAAAWVGVCSPQDIGAYTWTFKTLNGIVPDAYGETDLTTIEAGASAYIKEGGVNITSKGITTSGEYIDIIQGQYFLTARITEAVFGLLARMPKVSFRDSGISMVVAALESELKAAANQGVIAKDADGNPLYTISAPTASEVDAANKANRILPNVSWNATIDGAIEQVDISGVLAL
jgi:hypothetical protein